MSVYLDASVLVGLVSTDALAQQADTLLRSLREPIVVSDFAAAEAASAIGRKVRSGDLSRADAQRAMAGLDAEIVASAFWVEIMSADVRSAASFLRRFDLSLRAPDAINIAVAIRLGATLATLDRRMATDARRLGLTTVGEPVAGLS